MAAASEPSRAARHFLRKFLLFFLWGDPLRNPRRTPAPEYCISSRKRRSFEVRGRGGFRKEGDGGEGEKRRKKGRAKSAQNLSLLVP